MNDEQLLELAEIWRSEKSQQTVDIERLRKRYKRQRIRMIITMLLEVCLTLLVVIMFSNSLMRGEDLINTLWLGFGSLWALSTFVWLTRSRLQSLRLLFDKASVNTVSEQLSLLRYDISRCIAGMVATSVFALVTVFYFIALFIQQGANAIAPDALILSVCVITGALVFLYTRLRRARYLLSQFENH